ncbi:hypothetical protein LTR53_016237, partial [Teratosphaeriaceae sp. CCFEE 6253]
SEGRSPQNSIPGPAEPPYDLPHRIKTPEGVPRWPRDVNAAEELPAPPRVSLSQYLRHGRGSGMRLRDLFRQPAGAEQQTISRRPWRPPASGHSTARYADIRAHPFATAPTARRTLSAFNGNAVPVTPERAARAASATVGARSIAVPKRQNHVSRACTAATPEGSTPPSGTASTDRMADVLARLPPPPTRSVPERPAEGRGGSKLSGATRYFSAMSSATGLAPPGHVLRTGPTQQNAENETTITPVTTTSYGRLCPHKLASHLARLDAQDIVPAPRPIPQLDGHRGPRSSSHSQSPPSSHTHFPTPADAVDNRDAPPTPISLAAPASSHHAGGAQAPDLVRAKRTWRTRVHRAKCWRCALHDSGRTGWGKVKMVAGWTCFARFRANDDEHGEGREMDEVPRPARA